MKRNELKKLLEQYSPKKIIFQYINGKINLTSKQIDFLIDLSGKYVLSSLNIGPNVNPSSRL